MKKYISALIFTFILILTISYSTIASPLLPQPVCKITAKVLSIEKKNRFDKYDQKTYTYIKIEAEIIDTGKMIKKGYNEKMSCKIYPVRKKFKVSIVKEKDFLTPQKTINKNSIIKGAIQFAGDERGHWYNLTDIIIINNE